MAARNPPVTIIAGDTVALSFVAYDAPTGTTPLDLTGSAIVWQVRDGLAGDPLIEKITGDGITITDADAGTFTVLLEAADTLLIPVGRYPHGAVVTDADGNVSTISTGFIVGRPASVV